LAKGYGAGLADGHVPDKGRGVGSFVLALEKAGELGVVGGLLAVRDTQRRGCVAGLLDKDLGELDHGWITVERMGEIDHVVGGILLIARSRGSKKGAKRSDCNWVALFTAPSSIACSFPFRGGCGYDLSNPFGEWHTSCRTCDESEKETRSADHVDVKRREGKLKVGQCQTG
jgi:hypothetical protein